MDSDKSPTGGNDRRQSEPQGCRFFAVESRQHYRGKNGGTGVTAGETAGARSADLEAFVSTGGRSFAFEQTLDTLVDDQ